VAGLCLSFPLAFSSWRRGRGKKGTLDSTKRGMLPDLVLSDSQKEEEEEGYLVL
jgi:hypothetical protein